MAIIGVRTRTALAAAATLALSVVVPVGVAGAAPPPAGQYGAGTGTPYANPVSKGFADTFADPSVIRGKDGWWYAYGTTDPLREGEGDAAHRSPIAALQGPGALDVRGDAFDEANLPAWADRRGAGLWAPDIRYVDGRYRLYYIVTDTTVHAGRTTTRSGWPPPPPRPDRGPTRRPGGRRRGPAGAAGDFLWTFDPAVVTDVDGTQYLFYGSYYGGIWVTGCQRRRPTAAGAPTQVAIDNKYEGAYVVRHDGWYYLFASSANCCAGPTTGYSVHVGPLARPARAVRRPRGRPADRPRAPAARRCSRRTATAGSAPATTPSSPTSPVRTGSSTTRSTAPTPT